MTESTTAASMYLKTVPGILKIIEIAISAALLICIISYPFVGYGFPVINFLCFAAVVGLILTILVFLIHVLDLMKKLLPNCTVRNFSIAEIIYSGIITGLFVIAAIVALIYAHHISLIFAVIFFFADAITYGVDIGFQVMQLTKVSQQTSPTSVAGGGA